MTDVVDREVRRRRRPNHRLVKRHRNYTVEEVASLLGVHRNTVRLWLRQSLQAIDNHRPTLVTGRHLVEFLTSRRQARRRPCGPGEMYCLRCRAARKPAGGMADYVPAGPQLGNLVGICPCCETLMYRRVAVANLESIRGELTVGPRTTGNT